MNIFDLKITVVDQIGACPLGYKIGDEFYIRDGKTPSGFCITAFSALIPGISVLMMGGSFPWEKDPESTKRGCQDFNNLVIFEITRLR